MSPSQRFAWAGTIVLTAIVMALGASVSLHADIKPEVVGKETMATPSPTWLMARDGLGTFYIFDASDGEMHGLIGATAFTPAIQPNVARGELYVAESYYSRLHAGERTDLVRIYDLATLSPKSEIEVPKRIAALPFRQYVALMEDGKHLAVFNLTPAQSVSIVDVQDQKFVTEITTPGCALIMQTAGNGFLQMCGDGRLQWIRLDENGQEAGRTRSKQVFDIEQDPFFDKPVLTSNGWLVLSYEGKVFDVSVEKNDIEVSEPWDLLTQEERDANWRPGGQQFYGYHKGLDLLFVLMNQEGGFSHDSAGSEVWIYDRSSTRKIASITLAAPGSNLWVSQNDAPLLTVSAEDRQLHVFDVATTRQVRTIAQVGVAPGYLQGF